MAELTAAGRTNDEQALANVVTAARKAFARYGVHRTRMEDIAAGAGIPRQYLYRYVASKEQLLELAVFERCREFADEIHQETDALKGPLEDRLVAAVILCIRRGRDDKEFAYLTEALPHERLSLLLSGPGSPVHETTKLSLAPVLDRARDEERLRTDVDEDTIIDWLQGQMTWITPREDLDEPAIAQLLHQFVLPSILID
jgi:AcrR family transcriptional regulator